MLNITKIYKYYNRNHRSFMSAKPQADKSRSRVTEWEAHDTRDLSSCLCGVQIYIEMFGPLQPAVMAQIHRIQLRETNSWTQTKQQRPIKMVITERNHVLKLKSVSSKVILSRIIVESCIYVVANNNHKLNFCFKV